MTRVWGSAWKLQKKIKKMMKNRVLDVKTRVKNYFFYALLSVCPIKSKMFVFPSFFVCFTFFKLRVRGWKIFGSCRVLRLRCCFCFVWACFGDMHSMRKNSTFSFDFATYNHAESQNLAKSSCFCTFLHMLHICIPRQR